MNYEKAEPQKEPLAMQQKGAVINKQEALSLIKDAGKEYRKEDGKRLPQAFYILVSGGEKRERDYFSLVEKHSDRIKLEFCTDSARANPRRLLDYAKERRDYYAKSESEENPDKVYLLSDVDHFECELRYIAPKCVQENFTLIISNPCFEIWLYYGRSSKPLSDFHIPEDKRKMSKALKGYLNDKVAGGIRPNEALFDVEVAIQNAKSSYRHDADKFPSLFSTNMFVLAEEILPLIQKELESWKKESESRKAERRDRASSVC